MNRLNFVFLGLTLFSYHLTTAQGEIEMADSFRGEGKIYVVLAVLLVILSGLFFSIFRIEKKVKKVEKELDERNK